MKRGMIFGSILVAALVGFEIFNFSMTDFALRDFLGDERFIGVRWATILAVAFCGIDLGGLAGVENPRGPGQFLLAAWFLAATLNALATWSAVALGFVQRGYHPPGLVPVAIGFGVWLVRLLIIYALGSWTQRFLGPAPHLAHR